MIKREALKSIELVSLQCLSSFEVQNLYIAIYIYTSILTRRHQVNFVLLCQQIAHISTFLFWAMFIRIAYLYFACF
jgi:hypothetical protein